MTTEATAEGQGSAMDWPAAPISHARLKAHEDRTTRFDDMNVTNAGRAVRLVIMEAGSDAHSWSRVEASADDAVVFEQRMDESPGSFAVRVLRRLSAISGESKIERADLLVGSHTGRAYRQARALLARVLSCELAVSDLVFRADGDADPEVHDDLIALVEEMLDAPECRSLRISIRVSGTAEHTLPHETT